MPLQSRIERKNMKNTLTHWCLRLLTPFVISIFVSSPSAGSVRLGPQPGAGESVSVTLVTGDRVYLKTVEGGGSSVEITPAKGREGIHFIRTYGSTAARPNGDIVVLPSDAAPLVAAGRLDI